MVTVCPSQFATRRTLFHVLVGCGLLMLKVSRLKLPVIWLLVSMWLDRKSGSAGMPRPISYAVFCLKKKRYNELADYSVTNKYRYAYSGMDWQPELGLDLYDFGARNYDPAIGRWLNMDPVSEFLERSSPYVFFLNKRLPPRSTLFPYTTLFRS